MKTKNYLKRIAIGIMMVAVAAGVSLETQAQDRRRNDNRNNNTNRNNQRNEYRQPQQQKNHLKKKQAYQYDRNRNAYYHHPRHGKTYAHFYKQPTSFRHAKGNFYFYDGRFYDYRPGVGYYVTHVPVYTVFTHMPVRLERVRVRGQVFFRYGNMYFEAHPYGYRLVPSPFEVHISARF